jgi:RNA polymerase sigma-70 factor (ECF subfamily)
VADRRREAWLEAARQGDGDALEALLKDVQPQVYRFSLKMCGRPEDAQDVLQETLLSAARTVRGFRGASSVSTWLYTIARSFCIKRRRRRVYAPEVVSLDAEPAAARAAAAPTRDPERSLADREVSSALQSAIAALEPGPREVLVLRDVEGLPTEEVATITGLSVAAVKSRLHRARVAVRERLAPLLAPSSAPAASPLGRACPDVVGLLSRHLEGEIGPEACAEMERHVAGCPRCLSACESLRETLRLCRASPPPEVHPSLQESIRRGIRAVLEERGA